MDLISSEGLSNYVQAMIDVAGLGDFPIHQNDNALLVVGPGITFTKTETDDQKPAWSIAQVTKQMSPTQKGMIQVSNDLWATVTDYQELEATFTNLLLQIHVRRARFYHWYMQVIRPQHSPVPAKRHKAMQQLLDLTFLPLTDHAGQLLTLLLLEAGSDGRKGLLPLSTATPIITGTSDSLQQALTELETYHFVSYQLQGEHINYSITDAAIKQDQSSTVVVKAGNISCETS
jgi:hypothetical protein